MKRKKQISFLHVWSRVRSVAKFLIEDLDLFKLVEYSASRREIQESNFGVKEGVIISRKVFGKYAAPQRVTIEGVQIIVENSRLD